MPRAKSPRATSPGATWRRLALAASLLLAVPAAADRIADIRSRGFLGCGVAPGVAGFATVDAEGRYSGFDIDICRVVAAAIFGQPDRVHFSAAPSVADFVDSPDIDLVVRRLTWTLSREVTHGLIFGPIVFYDGQGFLVRGADARLDGARVCVESGLDAGEAWPRNLVTWAARSHVAISTVVVTDRQEGERAFFGGRCDAYSADRSLLGAIRADAPQPETLRLLPLMISKEPLAPLMRAGDDRFFQLVRWSIFATIDAEELGVDSRNVEARLGSSDPDIAALLGHSVEVAHALGLGEGFVADIIRGVGNYAEIYSRNLAVSGRMDIDRGVNRLWTDGGLIYAPPFR